MGECEFLDVVFKEDVRGWVGASLFGAAKIQGVYEVELESFKEDVVFDWTVGH